MYIYRCWNERSAWLVKGRQEAIKNSSEITFTQISQNWWIRAWNVSGKKKEFDGHMIEGCLTYTWCTNTKSQTFPVVAAAENRQHCRLSICENWLSWTNTETAAATPPTVMQNLLRASAQWLVLESAVFWLISPPTWVNWHMKMFLVHFTHYSGAERGNFVRNLWILSYILSLKFGEALLLVRTEYWTNESFAPNLRSLWHIPQIWGEAPIGWILCADQ